MSTQALARAKTGIAGLDEILHGGLIPARLYLVDGNPGAGKTTLALQFLQEGASAGERCLYVTLSETAEELKAGALSHEWSLVRLPLMDTAQSPAAGDEAARGEPPQRPRLRILVVDDITDVADVLKMLLDLEGFETLVAYSGQAALESAREFRPDVVICDIGLPEMDGHEIARRLRGDPKVASATLIALTGWGAEDELRRTRESGFDFHLVKPVDANALLDLLSQISPRTALTDEA